MLQLAKRPIGRWFFDPVGMGVPPAKLHQKRMLAVGRAVSPANRPEGRLPSPLPRSFSTGHHQEKRGSFICRNNALAKNSS
jgi:hypothetical protein